MRINLRKHNGERGDTLPEIAIAMAVAGLALVSTSMIMSRSLANVMDAVERTSARGQINSQIELLRYVFDTNTGANYKVAYGDGGIIKSAGSNSSVGDSGRYGCESTGSAFYLKIKDPIPVNTNDSPIERVAVPSGKRVTNQTMGTPTPGDAANGVWIEADKHEPSGGGSSTRAGQVPGYIDFYVRSCWNGYGDQKDVPSRLESTVRVYYRGEDR